MSKKLLVTSALPYANGSIHLGHLVEYIQSDIWVRAQRMMGHECRHMCADDTHGTPIMLSARKAGISPEELIAKVHTEHSQDFQDFLVEFDNYYTTNSPENREFAETIYLRLKAGGYIDIRSIRQFFCEHDGIFLPDRLIRGTCPKCGAEDQYGDACEICSATYQPTDLKVAHCSLCGNSPVLRDSEHHFVKLGAFADRLKEWISVEDRLNPQIRRKLEDWFQDGLQDWDISRDAPYFGFQIPGTTDKYFYVWLDAPVGYMASTKNWAERHGQTFEDWWQSEDTDIVHFIGKDITYFHCLFWPAMLMGSGFRAPRQVNVHGFLTVDGKKMSKSRGTFIKARTWLKHLGPEYLRYYYAAKLSDGVDDLDLNFQDFVSRVNAELINTLVNLGSRTVNFLNRKLDGQLCQPDEASVKLLAELEAAAPEILGCYQDRRFSHGLRRIMKLADDANLHLTETAPWTMVKTDPEGARAVCSGGVNLFYRLCVLLAPVLPDLARKVGELTGHPINSFGEVSVLMTSGKVGDFGSVMERVAPEKLDAIREEAAAEFAVVEGAAGEGAKGPEVDARQDPEPLEAEIEIDAFAKVDLRVGVVLTAAAVEGADKLLQLTVSLGNLGTRNVFAGIRKSHAPETLVGRKVILVANLKPRKMRFGLSEGMVCAAGPGAQEVYLLSPESDAKAGDRVH